MSDTSEEASNEEFVFPFESCVLLDGKETMKMRKRRRGSHLRDINLGYFPTGIKKGPRLNYWPEHEVEIMNAAEAAGKTKEELKSLVKKLVAARKAYFDWLANRYQRVA